MALSWLSSDWVQYLDRSLTLAAAAAVSVAGFSTMMTGATPVTSKS
jgi:hypothetical protein